MTETILALDIGSSAVKSAVLNHQSRQPLHPPAKVPYEIDYPEEDGAEIPAQRLHDAVWKAARLAIQAMPQGTRVDGIGLSCLMPALVLLDANQEPLAPIWSHLDRRSRPIARKILHERGDEFLHEIGNRPLPGGISALCYAQMLTKDASLKAKVKHYLHANGWLAGLMTGNWAFDVANASFTGLYGTVTTQEWSPKWCDVFGVDRAWLPPVVDGRETVGTLAAAVAKEWGLEALQGLPVKIGTADTSSAMLSADLKPGELLHSVGTTQVLATIVRDPKPDARRLTRRYGVGPEFIYVSHNPVGGSALPWLYELCFRDQSKDDFFAKTVPAAIDRKTEVTLAPPYLGGDRLEIEAKHAAFRELNLGVHREDLLAATLEAMREGHRQAFAALDWGGEPVRRLILTGGGADLIRHLIPEYAGAEIETIDEGALRGVATLFD